MDVSRPFSLSVDSTASNSEHSERVAFSDMHSYLDPAEVVSCPSSFRKHQKDFREAMSPLVASTRFQCNITQCTFEGINSGSGFIERCSSYPPCPSIRIMPSLDVVEVRNRFVNKRVVS